VDAGFRNGIAAGTKELHAVADMFWGDRVGAVVEPFGHTWSLATHKADLTPEELGQRGGVTPDRVSKLTCSLSQGDVVMPNTIRLHRVLRATPERVYRAFLDPDAMAKWLPPNGFTGKVHHLDAKVGGTYKMSFTNFTTGKSHSFGGTYLELVPHERSG
jgi:uncharacterized glyoxalase superfamily protein PhnB